MRAGLATDLTGWRADRFLATKEAVCARCNIRRVETRLALRQLSALVATMLRTAGLAALRRGLPLYFAVFIGAVAVFYGRYAMKASELVGLAEYSAGFRAVFLFAWFTLTLPVARAWVNSPSARFVRVFPVSWPAAVLVLTMGLVAVQLPWIILWFAGGGPLSGIWAAVVAAGAHALALGRPRRTSEWVGAALWLGSLTLGPGPLVALALPTLVLSGRRAWIEGWEPRVPQARTWVHRGAPASAIARAHLASLVRRQGMVLARWAWLGALGVGVAVLAIRNNRLVAPDRIDFVSVAVLAPVTIANLLTVGAAILRVERRSLWLFEVLGTSSSSRFRGAALALAVCGFTFGLAHGVLVTLLVEGPYRVWAAAASTGGGLGVVAALTVRWADRGTGQDSGRFISAGLLISAMIIGAAAWLGEIGVAVALGLSGAIVGTFPVRRQVAAVAVRVAEDQD
jgi:hypothetical protein